MGLSRATFCKEFNIPIRTVEDWDNEKLSSYPKKWVESLIIEKLKSMDKRSGLKMLDAIRDCEIVFDKQEAANLARLAIKCQIEYYKKTNEFYNYTPEILEDTLKKINPQNMGDEPLTVEEIIKKIEDLSVFIY